MQLYVFTLFIMALLTACGGGNKSQEAEIIEPEIIIPEIIEPPVNLSLADFVQQIENLTLDEFYSQSFQQLLLRDPEQVLREGRAEELELTNVTFTDISRHYRDETQDFYNAVLTRLIAYDITDISLIQHQHFDMYLWWLEDQLSLMEYPQFQHTAMQALTLNQFFLGLQPILNEADAVNYVEQLTGLSDQYVAMLILMNDRKSLGIVDTSMVLQHVVNQLNQLVDLDTTDDPIYQHFTQVLTEITITENRRLILEEEVQDLLQEKIRPAQTNLTLTLESMLAQAPESIGLGQYPDGDKYFQSLLAHHLTMPMTAEQLFQLGNDELNRVQQVIMKSFDELGYPIEDNFEQLFNRLETNGVMIEQHDVVATFETLVSGAEASINQAFDIPNLPTLLVEGSFQDGYFPASKDGLVPGTFVTDTRRERPYYLMPSLAYHEGVPGHHLQSTMTQSLQLPLLRTQPRITAYVEGWALYTENLAYELGWFDNDESANLGRLQWEALRSARLIADVGVNVNGWSWDEAVNFLSLNTGLPTYAVTDFVTRFVVNPGQATAYTVGKVKLLELREKIKLAKGTEFTLEEFHQKVLSSGPMPLPLLRKYVDSQ